MLLAYEQMSSTTIKSKTTFLCIYYFAENSRKKHGGIKPVEQDNIVIHRCNEQK